MKIVIETITGWEKDDVLIEGDRSHGGLSESEVLLGLAQEVKEKKESEWTTGLPYTYEAEIEADVNSVFDPAAYVQDALDSALSAYKAEHCGGDYLIPVRFEGKIVA